MNGNEHRSLVGAPKLDPLGERNKVVVGARHQHPVFAGFVEPVAKLLGKIQHNRLLVFAGRRGGSAVEAAMTWVKDDEGSRVLGLCAGIALGLERRSVALRPVVERYVAQEAVTVGGDEVEYQARGLGIHQIEDKRLLDSN